MKLLIKLLIVLAILGVLLIGGIAATVWFGLGKLDELAKAAVERGGTYALEVDTTLASADVALTKGTFAMSGLNIANPTGFSAPHFLTMNDSMTRVDYSSLGQPTLVIPEVTFSGIDMHMQRNSGGSNYQTIIDSLKRLESGEKEAPPENADAAAVIQKLSVKDITVHLDLLPIGGSATTLDVEIPEIVLNNIGGDEPLPVTEIAGVVLKAIFQAVIAKAGNVLPEGALGDLVSGLGQLQGLGELGIDFSGEMGDQLKALDTAAQEAVNDAVGQASDAAQGVVDDAKKEVDDAVKDATDRVKDIIKNPLGGG